jgi:hypothetical protein
MPAGPADGGAGQWGSGRGDDNQYGQVIDVLVSARRGHYYELGIDASPAEAGGRSVQRTRPDDPTPGQGTRTEQVLGSDNATSPGSLLDGTPS